MHRKRIEELYEKDYLKYIKFAKGFINKSQSFGIEPEDVVQETFYRCLKYGHSTVSMDETTFLNWVRRILKNTFRTMYNKKTLSSSSEHEYEGMSESDILYRKMLADEIIQKIEDKGNEEEKKALKYYFILGYPLRELPSTVGIDYHKAVRTINSFKRAMGIAYKVEE